MAFDLHSALAEVGLHVNFAESFWTSSHAVQEALKEELVVEGVVIPYVCAQTGSFKHLGSTLSLDGRSQISLQARLECGWKAFFSRMDVWKASAPSFPNCKFYIRSCRPVCCMVQSPGL